MGEFSVVGKSVPRVDAYEKVTGKAKFGIDLALSGMLHVKILRSPYPHAKIIHIDTTGAEKLPGVRGIVTGKDVPEERIGFIRDRYVMGRDKVRFVGEAVAAVAADTVEAAEEALQLIDVRYEELPAIFDAAEAMQVNPRTVIHPDLFNYARAHIAYPLYRFEPDMPNVYIHRQVRRGDTVGGFAEADLVLENTFSLPMAQHCSLERHNAVARPEPDGGLTVWISTHMLYAQKNDLCRVLGISPAKLRARSLYVGGSFGGKSPIIVSAIASLLALKTGRPVKLALNRDEVFVDGTSRAAMDIHIKDGVKRDGKLLAREMKLILNAGAYSGITTLVVKNAAFGAVGTYRIPNFKLDSYGVATNEPPTGAYRGFGTTEVTWAIESQMDMIAEQLALDPVELRLRNVLREGEEDVCGMVTHSIGARECLGAATAWIGWGKEQEAPTGPWKSGKGVALCNKYTMPGTRTVVQVKVHQDATIEVRHSGHEIGQGSSTVLAQIAAEEFATSMAKIRMVATDTAITPFDAGTMSSRLTFHAGNALRLACQDAKSKILAMAAGRLAVPVENLQIVDGVVRVPGAEGTIKISALFAPSGYLLQGGELLGSGTFTGPLENEDHETGQGKRPVTYYAHGATAVEVLVNVQTGEIKVVRAGTSFDMGRPINPKLCEGQMEGGLGMGLGNALYEEIISLAGRIANPNFLDYRIPSSLDLPACANVQSMITAVPHQEGPYGAKGFSEGTLVAVAPAIANAVYRATGARIKDLPITKEKVLRALNPGIQ